MHNNSNEHTLIISILFLLVSLMIGAFIHKLEYCSNLYKLNFPMVQEAISTFHLGDHAYMYKLICTWSCKNYFPSQCQPFNERDR